MPLPALAVPALKLAGSYVASKVASGALKKKVTQTQEGNVIYKAPRRKSYVDAILENEVKLMYGGHARGKVKKSKVIKKKVGRSS